MATKILFQFPHNMQEKIRKGKTKNLLHLCMLAYVYSGKRKKTSVRKRRGEGAERKKREGACLAQWALLVSQWQCQGSWQGPDARHQLQRLVNRLLSRRHICTAMVAHTHTHWHTHTGMWAHAYTMAGTQTDTDLLCLPNLVKGTGNFFVCC